MIQMGKFSIFGLFFSILYWIFDSTVHKLVFGEKEFEFFPDNLNELWMRSSIFFLLLGFSIFVDYHANKLAKKEREITQLKIYQSTVSAANHILNNFLNQVQVIKIEASECKDFDQEVLKTFDQAFSEANALVNQLSNLDEISEENIKDSILPK